jgi:hypothetical protein
LRFHQEYLLRTEVPGCSSLLSSASTRSVLFRLRRRRTSPHERVKDVTGKRQATDSRIGGRSCGFVPRCDQMEITTLPAVGMPMNSATTHGLMDWMSESPMLASISCPSFAGRALAVSRDSTSDATQLRHDLKKRCASWSLMTSAPPTTRWSTVSSSNARLGSHKKYLAACQIERVGVAAVN